MSTKILVVDDDSNICELLRLYFEDEGYEVKDIEMPDGIVSVTVCKDSGKLPTDLCRHDSRGDRVYTEYFIKGTEPTTYCDAHVSAEVNSSNNKLATSNTPKNLIVNINLQKNQK